MISATAQVVAIANLIGEGSVTFNGSYSGFASGAPTFYLPSVVFNYYGWYSLISVQNVGSSATNITATITCENGSSGTLTANGVQPMASHHFVLKTTTPTGFNASTVCNGSADITASGGQPIVVVDNQSAPTAGNTQSYSGVSAGASSLYIPALYTNYFQWDSSINIRKVGSGNTTVRVTYSDTGGFSECALTDAAPSCLLYMPTFHPAEGYFGATVTSTPAMDLVAVVNSATSGSGQAQTYNAVAGGTTQTVGIPSVMKSYFGWNTSFTCQNVSATASTLEIEYAGYAANAYNTPSLAANAAIEIFTPSEAFLPAGHQGGATITANNASAKISCIVNFNNATQMGLKPGDWSMSYNAFNK
jgi:hypothetical protein